MDNGRIDAQGSPYADGLPVPVPETLFSSASGERGLKAEFFNGNGFTGKPVVTRIDRHIDFDWT